MNKSKTLRRLSVLSASLIVLEMLTTAVFAQTKVEGVITGRSGATVFLKTAENPNLVVVLNDMTQVSQVVGLLKARRKAMSMAALIPGLPVQAEGTTNAENQLVATSIKFKGNDLEAAQNAQAGMQETNAQVAANQAQIHQTAEELAASQAQIKKSQEEIAAQKAALAQQQAALSEQEKKVAANKIAIAEANARFGQLGDYNIMDEVTVLFANGKVTVDAKYKPQLQALADKAKGITAYMIQVKGYASATGSVVLNQKLSEDRANNVVNFLLQQGHVPMTNMLAPGAMGESRQVGSDKTAESEAQNRRVVVRVLQNKGIAGT